MKCVETWPLPAEPRAGFGPAARAKAGPDQEMAASSETQALPQPNVSSVATRGPPPRFSLLRKGVAFLPAALALQPPTSEQKPEGGGGRRGGKEERSGGGSQERKKAQERAKGAELAPNQRTYQ